jgi:clan AA aspartic protease (TIGR02281 family)
MAPALAEPAACQLTKIATLPVTMIRNQPIVEGSINGKPIRVLIDTGSNMSLVWRSEAERLGLKANRLFNVQMHGIGGRSTAAYAKVEKLTIGDLFAKDMDLLVSGEGHPPFSMILGQDLLGAFDVEFDLANHQVILFKAHGCEDAKLAYWAKEWGEAPIARTYDPNKERFGTPQIRLPVEVNGETMSAYLDSGSMTSVLTLRGAARAGITPASAGVATLGVAHGIGAEAIEQWGATFDSFKIGDETIRNAKIRMADLFRGGRAPPDGPAMLLGADFLQAHHVYIANSQRRLYFTHNGGPVFQVIAEEPSERPALPPPAAPGAGPP